MIKNSPILYSFRRCPYAIRARMSLAYSGVRVELREVKLSNMPKQLLALSPKATIPVLQIKDDFVLEESLDIIYWALSQADPEAWLVDDDGLIKANDQVFKPLLDQYKYADRYPHKTLDEHRLAALPFLQSLENKLQENAYLVGARFSVVDLAIMPFIRQFSGVEPKWFEQCEFVYCRRWLQRILNSERFTRAMLKYTCWAFGDDPVYFP